MQPGEHILDIAFQLRERSGSVSVSMRPNDAPGEAGHDLLDATLDPAVVAGFPIITAVLDYIGYGPRAWCGWLQVLHVERAGKPTEHIVDAINVMGSDSPLYCFGYLPTFADAPASPGHSDMDWRADTFLVAIPGIIGASALQRVCGFRWGYDLRNGKPQRLRSPTVTGTAEWDYCRPTLTAAHPGWTLSPDGEPD
jgi:hypothetical protein